MSESTPEIVVENWELIDFTEAWCKQREIAGRVLEGSAKSTLVLCEHPSVITLGRNTKIGSVVAEQDVLSQLGIQVIEINRGGDATLHNPGQLVGYPIFDLNFFKPDLHWFLREIELCIIEMLQHFGIRGEIDRGLTGVWVRGRKICAIGIHCSRWITQHGFALNITNNLDEFNMIVPCGLADKEVTSMRAELDGSVDFDDVSRIVATVFSNRFNIEYIESKKS